MDYAIGKRASTRRRGSICSAQHRADRPKFQNRQCRDRTGFDLAKLAGDGKIATGDVKAVPVGKYAKAALRSSAPGKAAEPKFAMAESVRAALTLVARGEARSESSMRPTPRSTRRQESSALFGGFASPIIYPVAATATASRDRRLSLLPAFIGSQNHSRKIWLHVS